MNTLLERLRRLLSGQTSYASTEAQAGREAVAAEASNAAATLDDTSLTRLLHLVEQTEADAYSCQETLDLLDEYAEIEVSERDAARLMPLVKGHLDHCVDCTERYEALLRILESS